VTSCKFRALRSLTAEMAVLAGGSFERAVAALGGPGAIDLVTCVPVHRDRDLERGFDQAALLAAAWPPSPTCPSPRCFRAHVRPTAERLGAAEARRQRARAFTLGRHSGR